MEEVFWIDGEDGPSHVIRVDEAGAMTPDLVRAILEIDLQTFAEGTFTSYTAAVFLQHGRVFLLRADDVVIGTCVLMRTWEDPDEATVLAMGIRPGWRGRGLGQRFVAGVLQRLLRSGVRRVTLMVASDNRRALRVYRDVGFSQVAEREADPRTHDTLIVLRADLASLDSRVPSSIPASHAEPRTVDIGKAANPRASVPPPAGTRRAPLRTRE